MRLSQSLSYKNCINRPARTIPLILLAVALGFVLFLGGVVNVALERGLSLMESRLGADIIVVPYVATTMQTMDDMVLQGQPGAYYMTNDLSQQIMDRDGIEEASTQVYITTLTLPDCPFSVELIGIDAQTDFVISPWTGELTPTPLEQGEIWVGHAVAEYLGSVLTIGDIKLSVIETLDQSDTYIDYAVFADLTTIAQLTGTTVEEMTLSSVLIRVADGYSVEEVLNDINVYVRNVVAVRSNEMVEDTTGKLEGIAGLTKLITVVIVVCLCLINVIAFSMMLNERRKEIAILRVLGASRKKLFTILRNECVFLTAIGGLFGVIITKFLMLFTADIVAERLELPLCLPDLIEQGVWGLATVVVLVLATIIGVHICISGNYKVAPAIILRGEK